jgi:7-carboxy-7-deazaguanine synthase
VRKRSTYRVKSIFGPTLQGEGSAAGTVVKFLRLAGCNRWTGLEKDKPASVCSFCDTDFRGGKPMTPESIIDELERLGSCRRVVITGGEPTLQLDEWLCAALVAAGYKIHLETNGSSSIQAYGRWIHHVTLSPKQPISETKLEWCTDLKILYPLIHDGITMEQFSEFPAKHRFLQPVWDKDYEANVRATICRLYGNPEWRLSLQTHKIVGVE